MLSPAAIPVWVLAPVMPTWSKMTESVSSPRISHKVRLLLKTGNRRTVPVDDGRTGKLCRQTCVSKASEFREGTLTLVKNVIIAANPNRFLLPGVLRIVLHFSAFASCSARKVSLISSYSNKTSSSLASPFPWYSTRNLKASSCRPRDCSHRGLSGMN